VHSRPSFGRLLVNRPLAVVALIPQPLVLFGAGAAAGALGKTLTAPLDRVKLLLQTRGGFARGSLREAAKKGNVINALLAIGKQEGVRGYWKGNLPQILKVIPYSATQLYAYEAFKGLFKREDGSIGVRGRLLAGACAGMTATLMTYPLDTMRLRMAVDPSALTLRGTARMLLREGSYSAFFRGLGASLFGTAPYMAMELCLFDSMPKDLPPFLRGFTAALISTTACYPLDTIRRHIQLQSTGRLAIRQMARQIVQKEGIPGFYRGFVPSAVKNLPNKGLKLSIFDGAKKLLVSSQDAYEEECQQIDMEVYKCS